MASALKSISIDEGRYLALLEKMINVAGQVQNSPPDVEPHEAVIADLVFAELKPYLKENGGPLEAKRYEYKAGRPNIVVTYPGKTDKTISLVGMHMDVVPADPATWDRNPFKFVREGDAVYGRGTTDCLGHVALVTCLLAKIAEFKPDLQTTVHAVFIASEELPWPGVGIDEMMNRNELGMVMGGPVLWVDSANSNPCIGTAASTQWLLEATGKLFHSGFPNSTVNAMELAMDAVHYMQDRFYEDFPPTAKEQEYKFTAPSSFKPTTALPSTNGVNQIPGNFAIRGDIRLSPSYTLEDMKAKVNQYIVDFMAKRAEFGRGPSKYIVDGIESDLKLTIEPGTRGVYCDMTSKGFKALDGAISTIRGSSVPFSVSGSLPIVGDLKANEYALVKDLMDGGKIMAHFIANYEESA